METLGDIQTHVKKGPTPLGGPQLRTIFGAQPARIIRHADAGFAGVGDERKDRN
jgi:hypothetical protein